jgi:hypothetical protein
MQVANQVVRLGLHDYADLRRLAVQIDETPLARGTLAISRAAPSTSLIASVVAREHERHAS